MKKPLPRLEDSGEPPFVRELIEAGREFELTDYAYETGLQEHLTQLQLDAPAPGWAEELISNSATASAGGATAGGATATISSGLAGWIAIPVVTAAVTAAVVTALVWRSDEAPRPEPPQPAAVPQAATPQIAPASPREAAPQARLEDVREDVREDAREDAREDVREDAREDVREDVRVRPASPAPARKRPQARAATAVGQRPGREQAPSRRATATAEPARSASTARSTAPARSDTPAGARYAPAKPQAAESAQVSPLPEEPEPAVLDDARLEREMRMLAVARRVLDDDPQRALRLARQGEHEFGGSMFTQERQHVLLLALVKLGRMEQAKRLARPYLEQYPNGPFSDRVRRALLTGKVEH